MSAPAGNAVKGYALGLGFVALTAISTIFLSRIGHQISSLTMLFYTALVSVLVFNGWERKNLRRNHQAIADAPWRWFGMSLALVFVWVLTYYSAIHSSADFFLPTYFLTCALASAARDRRPFKAALCCGSLALVYAASDRATPLVLLSSVGSGLAGYCYYLWSYQFAVRTRISVPGVISVRFYLLFLFTVVVCLARGGVSELVLTRHDLMLALVLAFSNMIFPVLCSQNSLQIIGPSRFTFLTTLIPVVAFLLQATGDGHWPVGLFVACLLTTVALNLDPMMALLQRARGAPMASER